jgi:hypothetical protein
VRTVRRSHHLKPGIFDLPGWVSGLFCRFLCRQ